MKKDRNTFFNESAFGMTTPGVMPNMMPNMPMNSFSSQSSFYGGAMPTNQAKPTDYMSEVESRFAKIERQLNRIEARLNKLETLGTTTTENYDNTTNMYML